MAKKSQKTSKPTASSASNTAGQSRVPPTQLMNLVESFLSDQGFDNAHREFQKHRAKKGWKDQETGKSKRKEHHSLVSVFQTWKTFASQGNTPVLVKEDPMEKITKVSSSESDTSDESSSESDSDSKGHEDTAMADAPASEESSSSESSSSDDSDSESESEEESKPATSTTQATPNVRKRKAESESESSSESDSDEDMSDSSSDGGRPQAKKAKTVDSSDESSSSSDSSDDESSEDENEAKPKNAGKPQVDDESSSSESESDESDSESDAEPEVDLKAAAAVPLPDSSSSSSSESESDSDSDSDDAKPEQRAQDKIMNGAGSDTSATLDKTSPDTTYPPLPPDPSIVKTNNRGKNGAKASKTQTQPFSRIRQDVAIDPRLSSNAYVSHGYGEKAHQDLIVTKGKGFTKEKNKKKRGSYKGGPLDIHQSRSIKFDD